ncbi:IS66 family insertion sequence element accessory protein TnpA [Aneurinibacillus terranovensis]|uniref:IS66 family insertion sequence element accessory protein TnpA n=1 Tax=Aneurinibacillus terranovensis TaxID=278991 RepID=UPI001FDFE351|nr:transposase [Aneurinibacillus terranovensis]
MTRIERLKEWEERIATYRASGQSTKEWCEAHGVKPHQLWYWLRKLKSTEDPVPSSFKWVSVELDEKSLSQGAHCLSEWGL